MRRTSILYFYETPFDTPFFYNCNLQMHLIFIESLPALLTLWNIFDKEEEEDESWVEQLWESLSKLLWPREWVRQWHVRTRTHTHAHAQRERESERETATFCFLSFSFITMVGQ